MSSKKSANLGMHMWGPQDKFVREEFNENTEKIDAAIKTAGDRITAVGQEIRLVKLVDETLAQDQAVWQIDVSGIDFTQYTRVELSIDTTCEATLRGQVNGINTSSYCTCYRDVVGSNCQYLFELSDMSKSCYLFNFNQPTPGGPVMMFVTYGRRNSASGNSSFAFGGYQAPITWEQFETLDLRGKETDTVVPAGTRVILTGIKK